MDNKMIYKMLGKVTNSMVRNIQTIPITYVIGIETSGRSMIYLVIFDGKLYMQIFLKIYFLKKPQCNKQYSNLIYIVLVILKFS